MRARIAIPLCLLALVFYSGCGSQSKSDSTPESTVDTRFIPADATSVIVVYPARVLANPAIAKLDLGDATKGMEKELGVAPSEIEQIEMILTVPAGDGKSRPEIRTAAEIRFTKPHGGEAFVNRIISRKEPQFAVMKSDGSAPPAKPVVLEIAPEKVEYAGKVYYKPGKGKTGYTPSEPIISIVDERTLLIGDEAGIKASLDAKDVKSPLLTLVGKIDPAADFSAVTYQTDQLKKLVADAKAHGGVPPQFQAFADLGDSLDGSIFSIKTTPEISLSLTMDAKDDAAAEKLAAMVPSLKQMAEQGAAVVHQMAGAAPPDAKPMLDYGLGKLDKLVAGLVAKRDGKQVVIQINGLGTLDELATNVLSPAITQARAAAKRAQGMNNLRQLGLAMMNYESQFQSFPTNAIYSVDGKPLLSWRVSVLPYVDETGLYKQFHLDEPGDSPNNKPLMAKMPKVFMDPSDKDAGEGKTRYVVAVGKGTMFDGDKGIRFADIKDGSSNTVMILTVGNDKAVNWTQPEDLHFDPAKPLDGLGAVGEEGFNVVFADCSVRLLRKAIDADTFRKLILRADGEPIDQSKL